MGDSYESDSGWHWKPDLPLDQYDIAYTHWHQAPSPSFRWKTEAVALGAEMADRRLFESQKAVARVKILSCKFLITLVCLSSPLIIIALGKEPIIAWEIIEFIGMAIGALFCLGLVLFYAFFPALFLAGALLRIFLSLLPIVSLIMGGWLIHSGGTGQTEILGANSVLLGLSLVISGVTAIIMAGYKEYLSFLTRIVLATAVTTGIIAILYSSVFLPPHFQWIPFAIVFGIPLLPWVGIAIFICLPFLLFGSWITIIVGIVNLIRGQDKHLWLVFIVACVLYNIFFFKFIAK